MNRAEDSRAAEYHVPDDLTADAKAMSGRAADGPCGRISCAG